MKKLILTAIFVFLFVARPTIANAQSAPCNADINTDGVVDLSDYSIIASNFFSTSPSNPRADINTDGVVDLSDYSVVAANFLKSTSNCSAPAPTPVSTPVAGANEWTQFGHDPQNTNYTSQAVALPWKYKWQWNGAGVDGKQQAGHLSVPNLVQPITGGSRVYMVANNTIYALDKNTGQALWTRNGIGTLSATPAYYNEYLFVPSSDGHIYKLNASNGAIDSNFAGNGAFTTALKMVNDKLYAGTSSGTFYGVNTSNMSQIWNKALGTAVVSPASYSPSRNTLIVDTQDLFVHALNATNGTERWSVKPTQRVYQSGTPDSTGAQFSNGWPVIAEQHGIVFVRYRLDWDTLWTWNPYPTTNAEIRADLESQPNVQTLYALNLDTGQVAFIPAVGNGGAGDGGTLPMGPQPVVRVVNGKEVAYVIWRNGLTCAAGWCDGREDATMGEMVLDNSTVAGYVAGDMRFIRFTDIQTDEMMNITMAGDVLFHSHWLINSAERITDRSDTVGATFTNPIKTSDAPFVIWRQVYCPPTNTQCNPVIYPGGSGYSYGPSNCPFDAATRYCSAGLYSYGDQRGYPPGFYEYHNDYNGGSTPFTVASDSLVLVKTNDGGLIALENGNPTASVNQQNLAAAQTMTTQSVLGTTSSAPTKILYTDALNYVGQTVTATGVIKSVVNHRPKAMYLGFKDPHDGALLVRVFEKDLSKFGYDLNTLLGKNVEVSGKVTLYWPYNVDPEIIVTDPSQIKVVN